MAGRGLCRSPLLFLDHQERGTEKSTGRGCWHLDSRPRFVTVQTFLSVGGRGDHGAWRPHFGSLSAFCQPPACHTLVPSPPNGDRLMSQGGRRQSQRPRGRGPHLPVLRCKKELRSAPSEQAAPGLPDTPGHPLVVTETHHPQRSFS